MCCCQQSDATDTTDRRKIERASNASGSGIVVECVVDMGQRELFGLRPFEPSRAASGSG